MSWSWLCDRTVQFCWKHDTVYLNFEKIMCQITYYVTLTLIRHRRLGKWFGDASAKSHFQSKADLKKWLYVYISHIMNPTIDLHIKLIQHIIECAPAWLLICAGKYEIVPIHLWLLTRRHQHPWEQSCISTPMVPEHRVDFGWLSQPSNQS